MSWKTGKKTLFLFFAAMSLLLMLQASFCIGEDNVSGFVLEKTQTQSKFVFVPPASMTREGAFDALMNAEDEVSEMKSFKLNTLLMDDILYKAKASYIGQNITLMEADLKGDLTAEKRSYMLSLLETAKNISPVDVQPLDYSEVFRLTQIITYRKNQAYNLVDMISLTEEKIKQYDIKVDTKQAAEYLDIAKNAFNSERYEEAEDYLSKADASLSTSLLEYNRFSGLLRLGRSIALNYWWQLLLALAIIAAVTPRAARFARLQRAKRKLESLKVEQATIKELMKKAQEDCFRRRVITVDTYRVKADEYRARMTEIEQSIPILEVIVHGDKKRKKPEKKGILEIKEE